MRQGQVRVAVIRDGVVENVAFVGPAYEPPNGAMAIPSEAANIGDLFDGARFSAPKRLRHPEDLARRVSVIRDSLAALVYQFDLGANVVVRADLRQPTIANLAALARWGVANPRATREWKYQGNSTPLTGEQFVEFSALADAAVLDLFDKSEEVGAAITAATISTEEEVQKALDSILPPRAPPT